MCTWEFCRNWTETQEGSTNNCRGHTCSKRHVSARVIFSLCLNICLSTHRLNTSAPQTVTAVSTLQAPRKCSAHNCAPSASDTSRVFRSPSVNNNFHEQGMDSGGTSHKSGQGTNREKTRRTSACTALQNFRRSRGKKGNNPAAPFQYRQKDVFGLHTNMHFKTGARQDTDVRGSVSPCSLPLCGRSMKTFPTLLDDVSSN